MPSLILIVPLKREKGKNPMILLTCEFISEIESACNAGEPGLIPGSGRSPAEGIGYPLQYACLENPHGQRSLMYYSPWGLKELGTTE